MEQITSDMKKLIEIQIERITSELNRLIESQEAFAKLAEDTRDDDQCRRPAGDHPVSARFADRTSLAADDLRRSLPAMRDSLEELRQLARFLEEQPESVVLWSTAFRSETEMIRAYSQISLCLPPHNRLPGRSRLPVAASRHDTSRMIEPQLLEPHARAGEAARQAPQPRSRSAARYAERADTSAAECFTSNRMVS